MNSVPPISNSRVNNLLKELHKQLPNTPTAIRGLYECPKELMRKVIKSNYGEAALQQLSDHMGFYLGLFVRVKVRMLDHRSFDRQNPNFSAAAGLYRVSGDHREIVLTRREKYSFKHILAVMAHEYTHNYLYHHKISKQDPLENEYLTDTAAVFLGFGEVLLRGYEPFSWVSGTEQRGFNSYQVTQTFRIGYLQTDNIRFAIAETAKLRDEPDLLDALPFWDWHRLGALSFEVPKRVERYKEKRQLEELNELAEEAKKLWARVKRLSPRALNASQKRNVPREDATRLMEVAQTLSMGDFEAELNQVLGQVAKVSSAKTEEAGRLMEVMERICAKVRIWETVVARYAI